MYLLMLRLSLWLRYIEQIQDFSEIIHERLNHKQYRHNLNEAK